MYQIYVVAADFLTTQSAAAEVSNEAKDVDMAELD